MNHLTVSWLSLTLHPFANSLPPQLHDFRKTVYGQHISHLVSTFLILSTPPRSPACRPPSTTPLIYSPLLNSLQIPQPPQLDLSHSISHCTDLYSLSHVFICSFPELSSGGDSFRLNVFVHLVTMFFIQTPRTVNQNGHQNILKNNSFTSFRYLGLLYLPILSSISSPSSSIAENTF